MFRNLDFIAALFRSPENEGGGGDSMDIGGAPPPGIGLDGRAIPPGHVEAPKYGPDPGRQQSDPRDKLSPHFFDADGQPIVEELIKAVANNRVAIGEGNIPGADPTAYKFDLGPKAAEFMPPDIAESDPLMQSVSALAHKHGLPVKAFGGFMTDVLEEIAGTGNVTGTINFDEQLKELVPDEARSLDEQGQRQAAGRRVADALAWIDGAKAQQAIDDDVADYLVAQLGDSPKGIRALEFMQSLGRKTGPALGGHGGGNTDADLDRRLNDPRGDPNSREYDPNFARETDVLFQKRYG